MIVLLNKLLNCGWWLGIVAGVFLALLSCQYPGLELWAGISGAAAFSCAVGGMALALVVNNNG